MGITAYWLSNFIVDYTKYLIVAGITFILIFVFKVDMVTIDGRWGMFLLLLVFFGFAFIPMVYFFSFFFKSPTKGQIFIFLFYFITGLILVIIAFVLRLLQSSRDVEKNVIDYILRLVPFFSFNYGIICLCNLNLFKLAYKWTTMPSAFAPEANLWDLLYLIFTGIFFIVALYILETSFRFGQKLQIVDDSFVQNNIDSDYQKKPKEPDVIQEEEKVENADKNTQKILLKNVVKAYHIKSTKKGKGKKSVSYKVAVKAVSFGVDQGTVFCLLGTNGAGKTSIFKMLTADVYPTKGQIFVNGYEMPKEMLNIRHQIGYCPQFDALFENLTGREHLELYANLKGIKKEYQKPLIDNLIKSMNLTPYQHVKAETYSGGNKRKLSVAIAILGSPPIVFLDEPSSGMDPYARRFMWKVIGNITKIRKNSTVILTTHSMEEAEALSSKLAIMVEGRIQTIGTIQNLKSKYGNCLELDVKLKVFSREQKSEKEAQLASRYKLSEYLSEEQVQIIFQNEEGGRYGQEFSADGKAKGIWKSIKDNGKIKQDVIVEWFIIQ